MPSRWSSSRNVSSSTLRACGAPAPSPAAALTPWLTFGPIHASSCSISSARSAGYVSITRCGERAELGGEVDADRAELVADDAAGDAVPQRRHRHVPVESRLGRLVRLAQQREPVDRVGSVRGTERPAPGVSRAVDVRHRDHVLETGEGVGDRHPLRPRAEPAGVDVVAAGLGGDTASSRRSRCAPRIGTAGAGRRGCWVMRYSPKRAVSTALAYDPLADV